MLYEIQMHEWHEIGLQVCVSILMYADDILLLASSVSSLQNLLGICENNELFNLDMCLNIRKSMYTRIGPRYKLKCCNLVTNDGRKYCGLTPFVTWVFSLCRPAGFAANLITELWRLVRCIMSMYTRCLKLVSKMQYVSHLPVCS